MVAEGLACFAPDKNDVRLYDNGLTSATPTGITFPTTTDDSAAPPDTDRWLKITDSFADDVVNITRPASATPSIKNFNWFCQRGARIRGTLGSGQTSRYMRFVTDGAAIFLAIEWVYVSASTFNWRLTKASGRTLLGDSSSAFSTDTTYALRLQLDGTNATLWVDGAAEIQAAFTERLSSTSGEGIAAWKPENASQQHYVSGVLLSHSDTTADRPDTDVEIATLENTGDYATDQGYGDDGDCNQGVTTAVAADVSLDGSAQVDTSIYWCENAGDGDKQGVEMGTATFPVGKDPMVLSVRAVGSANIAAKTVQVSCVISDGSSTQDLGFANLAGISFVGFFQHFPTAPDTGAWTQTDLDALKISCDSFTTNGANDQWAAVIAEMCWVSADPPHSFPPISPLRAMRPLLVR